MNNIFNFWVGPFGIQIPGSAGRDDFDDSIFFGIDIDQDGNVFGNFQSQFPSGNFGGSCMV